MNSLKHKIKSKLGFTMIELLVVVTIITVLTTIGLVSYTQATKNARNSKRKSDLENVRQALVLYRTDLGSYPVTTDFNVMVTTISDYLSAVSISDPKNTDPYVYSFSSDGSTFTLTGYLEPDATAYSLTNP